MSHPPDEQAAEAQRTIARAEREGKTFLAGAPARLRRHFWAGDADPADKAELWGRRVGRALSLAACLVLASWLLMALAGS